MRGLLTGAFTAGGPTAAEMTWAEAVWAVWAVWRHGGVTCRTGGGSFSLPCITMVLTPTGS
eukprot:scaffold19247_cov135-Isochrysis_galbana.AAC.4